MAVVYYIGDMEEHTVRQVKSMRTPTYLSGEFSDRNHSDEMDISYEENLRLCEEMDLANADKDAGFAHEIDPDVIDIIKEHEDSREDA